HRYSSHSTTRSCRFSFPRRHARVGEKFDGFEADRVSCKPVAPREKTPSTAQTHSRRLSPAVSLSRVNISACIRSPQFIFFIPYESPSRTDALYRRPRAGGRLRGYGVRR